MSCCFQRCSREILSYKKQKKITAQNFKDIRNNNIESLNNSKNYITPKLRGPWNGGNPGAPGDDEAKKSPKSRG